MKILRKIVCNSKHTNFTNTFDFCIDGERNYEDVHYYVVRDINGKNFEIEDVTELSKQTGYRVELMDDSTLWIAAPEDDKRYLAGKLSLLSTDSILSSAIDSPTIKSVNSANAINAASLWMGKYVTPDNQIHKVYFEYNTSSFDKAEKELNAIIPEPYVKCRLLGSAPSERLLKADGFKLILSPKSVNSAIDLNSLQQIQSELNEKLYEVMTELPFGFSPEEVDEYSVVEVTEDQNMIKAEVRAELNYDELSELCEFLDPVVQKYDTNTYFEPVEPGIIEAYIHMNEEITSSTDITSSEDIDRTSEDLLANDAKFRYQMLDRMQQDCNYFLDYRDPKFLWAGDVNDQIRLMRDLYNSFSDDEKPEWINMDDIDELERAMTDKHT